jgi:outer membrane protein OmpA-like peptidoglycan-associated protein
VAAPSALRYFSEAAVKEWIFPPMSISAALLAAPRSYPARVALVLALLAAAAPAALAKTPATKGLPNPSVILDLSVLDELRPDPAADRARPKVALHRPLHKPARFQLARPRHKPAQRVTLAAAPPRIEYGTASAFHISMATVAALAAPALPMPPAVRVPSVHPIVYHAQALAPLRFAPGGTEIGAAGKHALEALATKLKADPSLRLELVAYASGGAAETIEARRLSLQRAIDVRAFLVAQGVRGASMTVRAMGNRDAGSGPADRVDLLVLDR